MTGEDAQRNSGVLGSDGWDPKMKRGNFCNAS